MSRLTVRPSAEIGSRKGRAAIASSGKDSGRRWMTTHSTASATAAPTTASTASTVVAVASVTHTRAYFLTSVKLRGERIARSRRRRLTRTR